MSNQKLIQALAMASVLGSGGFAHDFGLPMPNIRKRNKYEPPKQDVPDFSSMTRQQERRAKRLAGKKEHA